MLHSATPSQTVNVTYIVLHQVKQSMLHSATPSQTVNVT